MEPCKEYEALISAAVDGEATEAERRALMEHLSRCEGCRETYTQTLLLRDAFSDWEEEAPESLLPSVMEQVRREPRQKKRRRRSWMPLMAAAACLALIVVGFQMSGTLDPAVTSPPLRSGEPADSDAEAENDSVPVVEQKTENLEAKDPEPQVGTDVTQYGTDAPEADAVTPRAEAPQVTAFAEAPPVMTATCADPALLTWMEANVAQEGMETEEGVVWVISTAEWLKLEVRLQDGGCVYETEGEKNPDQLVDGDLVCVIYCAE